MAPTILLADDQSSTRAHLAGRLLDAGFAVVEARDGLEAWDQFVAHGPDLVLTDLRMPRCDGLELLERVRAQSAVPVIILTAYGDVPTAVRAMKAGAEEFLSFDGLDVSQLVERIHRLVRSSAGGDLARALDRRIVGDSRGMRRARERIAGLLAVRTPVMIVGEPGTGRRHVARAMHDLGSDADAEFIHVVCAQDPPPGRLLRRGTVYLDQSQLLSAENQRRWLGWSERSARGEPVARVISSSTPLPDAERLAILARLRSPIAEQATRLRVVLPRLADRLEDLPALCNHLIEQHASDLGRPQIELDSGALEVLRGYPWPGNVRELAEVLELLVAFAPRLRVGADAVADAMRQAHQEVSDFREQRDRQQRDELVAALRESGGNLTHAADRLGISRGAVRHRARKFGLLPSLRDAR
jgi:two-component system response regulator PilR (NtrC family)